MTDSTNNIAPTSKTPTHTANLVRNLPGGKSHWTRIGSAWTHKDGEGFNLQLDAIPLDGRIVVRLAAEKQD